MSAQDFGVVAIVLPNPQYDPSNGARIVNESFGFALRASGMIRTLSPNNPHHYDVIQGLLYSPDLPASSPCDNATRALIPSNVTTRAEIPPGNYPLIALAPWSTPECVFSYLEAMRSDQVRGALFFRPGNDSDQPPPVSDPVWNLQDGGQWKSVNSFPVYAIPGMLGAFLLDELAQYSGNMTDAPYGDQLTQIYDPHDTIRLFARMDLESTSGIPSLWVFLIIVLAILLAVVLLTSVVMHFIQRRQRRQLQRRVANGEVDLEALGIKRLQVPQELLDQMPIYTYAAKDEPDSITQTSRDNAAKPDADDVVKTEGNGMVKTTAEHMDTSAVSKTVSAGAPGLVIREVAFSQSTCPICLDDFVHGETSVRELPCNHIFHPECIDSFLRDTSSLCPMCKKSSLPAGYCPIQITNLMVRRERLMRRVRERGGTSIANTDSLPPPVVGMGRTTRTISIPMTAHPAPVGSVGGGQHFSEEMNAMGARRQTTTDEETPADVREQDIATRRARRVQRLAQQQARNYDERAEEVRAVDEARPLWRRIAGRFFPTIG